MKINAKGLLAISPLIVFLALFVVVSLIAGDFTKMPVSVAFLTATVYALATTKGLSLPDRIRLFAHGAGTGKIIFIIMIFVIAGAFAKSAEAMGCIDATVNIMLSFLPPNCIYISLFLAGCMVSTATGSGIGSIVALGPIAVGVGTATGGNMPLLCAIVVCGAMFGDNLSFISDTTIIATSTQGCEQRDKFKVNLWMALPASLITIAIYFFMGKDMPTVDIHQEVELIKVVPYIFIILFSIIGVNVMVVLFSGTILCGVLGLILGEFDFYKWMEAVDSGINGMSSMAIIVLFAAGLLAIIKYNGGIDLIVSACTRHVHSRRSCEACIALLTAMMTACTSNNTIAIVSASTIVKELSLKFGVDPRKAACLMDTGSCIALELLPYSMHLLVAAGFAGIAATSMIPYVFYAYLLLFFLIIAIIFNIPRLKPMKQA